MNSSHKRLALIPARGGSKRIPRKNIIDFFGQPIMSYPLKAAQESRLFNLIHVSTEDEEIRNIAERLGADVSIIRPTALADDHTSLLMVTRWVISVFDSKGIFFDDIFVLFPCAPFLEVQDLLAAYEMYLAHGRKHNLLTICRAPAYMEWYYRRCEDARLIPVMPGGALIRSQDLQPVYYETGMFAIFSREWLLCADSHRDDQNYIGYEIPIWRSIDIDEPEDLEYAKFLYQFCRKSS